MTDIKKNILTKKSTMSDAIRVLQECELKIICIVENNKLVGAITDGDIRRALLKNLTLDCDCNKIMNTNPEYSTTNNYLLTKNLLNKLGYKKDNIRIINPGCNYPIEIEAKSKDFARALYGDSFPKLITVSRLDKRKSHQNILMTIKNLLPKFPNLKYISIGDGEEKEKLKNLKKELGLTNEVTFIYKSSEQEKLGLLEKADLLVMPSVVYKKSIEGFGITFIEAASYGKPSVGGIFGGESDAIINGKTGYLCDGNDLSALYETLLKMLENDNFKELGKNAYEFSKNFNWNKIVKKYIELI